MNRRDAEIAYVLEGQPGVFGVFAVRGVAGIAYAVHVEAHGQSHVRAHYALLRVLTHEECAAVVLYHSELPASVRAGARELVLSPVERADARARVPLTTPALEQPPAPSAVPRPAPHSVLIVDMGSTVEELVVESFRGSSSVRIPGIAAAVKQATSDNFELILCDEASAFGPHGFVTTLERTHPEIARRVVVMMDRAVRGSARMNACTNRVLVKPISYSAILDLPTNPPFSIPVPPSRGDAPPKPVRARVAPVLRPRVQAEVLLVDEEAPALVDGRFVMTVSRDPWRVLDLIDREWALVICSLRMKTASGGRLYSLLWKALPATKRRFVLLVDEPGDDARVLTRPLTIASVTAMLDRIDFMPAPAPEPR